MCSAHELLHAHEVAVRNVQNPDLQFGILVARQSAGMHNSTTCKLLARLLTYIMQVMQIAEVAMLQHQMPRVDC